jgi:hypothetical protein
MDVLVCMDSLVVVMEVRNGPLVYDNRGLVDRTFV